MYTLFWRDACYLNKRPIMMYLEENNLTSEKACFDIMAHASFGVTWTWIKKKVDVK